MVGASLLSKMERDASLGTRRMSSFQMTSRKSALKNETNQLRYLEVSHRQLKILSVFLSGDEKYPQPETYLTICKIEYPYVVGPPVSGKLSCKLAFFLLVIRWS